MKIDATALLRTLEPLAADGAWDALLEHVLREFAAQSGTLHLLSDDGALHLAASGPLPPPVLEQIRVIPVGRGMAGLAVERAQPVTACNLQEDTSGDVRPRAKETGLKGSICVPVLDGERAVGALGVANATERDFSEDEVALLLDVGRVIARLR